MTSAYIISYNDEVLISDAINSLKPYVDKIVVAVSRVPYHGEAEPQDKTADIARSLGCVVIEGDWRTERSHRNAAIQVAEVGASLIIVCESDMVFEPQDIRNIIDSSKSPSKSPSRAFKAKQIAYWHDRKHIVLGDKYCPVVAIKPGVRVTNCANVDCDAEMLDGVKVHHYNWCAPKDIRRKVKTYHHAPQIASDWYDKCYLTWKEGEPARFPDCTLEVALADI
jgi:hypothetical protein